MNIVELITKKVNEIATDGRLEEIVEKYALQCINDVVKDSFNWSGEAKKSIKNALEGKLEISMKDLNLDRYRKIVGSIVEERVNVTMIEDLRKEIEKAVDKITGVPEKKTYKLSEIVQAYIDDIDKSYDGDMESEYGECTLIVENDGNFVWVRLDKESDKRAYECSERIHIYKNKISSLVSKGKPINPMSIDSRFYGFSKFIFKLYCNECTIEIDEQDCELEYYREDYD